MRDPERPPDHPLVELVYDLSAAVNEVAWAEGVTPATRADLYGRVRRSLRSARRVLYALERLVDELEAESAATTHDPPSDKDISDVDYQSINVR